MRRLCSEQTGLSYLSSGAENAPLVLCLHGFPDIPRTWGPLTERLCGAGYRVVSPWLPGYAPSSLKGPFDLATLGQTILHFVDELSPSKPIRIVGHDWGSPIAQCAMASRPERFRAAALLAVPHMLAFEENIEHDPRQIGRSAYMVLFQLPVLSERIVGLGNFRFIERLWKTWSPGFDPGRDYFEEAKVCLRSSMPAPLRYYRALRSPKVFLEVRRLIGASPIVVPTIYLHGERDGCIGPQIADGQEKHFSALFETVKLADAGHFLHLERPGEVNAAILRWFEGH
ncbi:MAG: alpha/beta hydrolase [Deltaproteobacteria bacterium]|nr:alpha/beta hydrolase [Deltaproteobacteria bacterium]